MMKCPDQERQTILNWLSPLNFELTQAKLSRERQDGTGIWFLESERFKSWCSGTSNILWCPGLRELTSFSAFWGSNLSGIAGAGKTIIAYEPKMLDDMGELIVGTSGRLL